MTATTIAGLFNGANPANDATYFVLEYAWVPGSTFCAVPVFPAEEYPSRTALFPVPSSTTFCIICFISAAVVDEMTRRPSAGWKATVCGVGCGSVVPATMRGDT